MDNNDEILKYSKSLYVAGVQLYGKTLFNQKLNEEIKNITAKMNGFSNGRTNITINMIKKYQKLPTQQKLDSLHILKNENEEEENSNEYFGYNRDINLYTQLSDFIDLLKPKELVVVKFHDVNKPIFVKYKKTQTYQVPWLIEWYQNFPECCIEYCTDIHNYLRIMGPLCSLINISNLLNRIESKDINYTLILLALTIFPESDISPITRNATLEEDEVIKSILYEDVHRKIKKIKCQEDKLIYSRSRNIFNLPALSGTNLF